MVTISNSPRQTSHIAGPCLLPVFASGASRDIHQAVALSGGCRFSPLSVWVYQKSRKISHRGSLSALRSSSLLCMQLCCQRWVRTAGRPAHAVAHDTLLYRVVSPQHGHCLRSSHSLLQDRPSTHSTPTRFDVLCWGMGTLRRGLLRDARHATATGGCCCCSRVRVRQLGTTPKSMP